MVFVECKQGWHVVEGVLSNFEARFALYVDLIDDIVTYLILFPVIK